MNKNLLIGIIAVAVIAIYFGGKEALPQGTDAWTNEETCYFITNVIPAESRYTSYGNSNDWIAADTNGDGIKEAYGYFSTSASGGCRGTPIFENYNPEGDDICHDGTDLSVGRYGSTSQYKRFVKDYGAASNAVLSCESEPSCWSFQEMTTQLNQNWVGC